MTQPCDNGAPKLAYEGHNVIAAGNVGLNWSFVHGPALDDPLMGLVRWSTTRKVFFWVFEASARPSVACGARHVVGPLKLAGAK